MSEWIWAFLYRPLKRTWLLSESIQAGLALAWLYSRGKSEGQIRAWETHHKWCHSVWRWISSTSTPWRKCCRATECGNGGSGLRGAGDRVADDSFPWETRADEVHHHAPCFLQAQVDAEYHSSSRNADLTAVDFTGRVEAFVLFFPNQVWFCIAFNISETRLDYTGNGWIKTTSSMPLWQNKHKLCNVGKSRIIFFLKKYI